MSFDFKSDIPIYLQVLEHIKTKIISREYLPNEKLPSVRELSLLFEINPNTVQKALFELENIGLIYTERTNGKFVTDNQEIINQVKKQTIMNMVNDFYKSMADLGFNKEEVLEILSGKE